MRVIFIFILCCSQMVLANNSFIKQLSGVPARQVEQVDLTQLKPNQLYLSTPFAKPIIINAAQRKMVQEKVVIKIELVYTQYRKSPSFDQQKLNQNRLKQLSNILPSLFKTPLWDYELIEQTKGNSRADCNQMFHGFILTFRPNSSKSNLEQEADYLEKLVDVLKKNDSLDNDSTPKEMFIRTHYDPKWGYIHDTNYVENNIPLPSPPNFFYDHSLYQDSTVINALARLNLDKPKIIVTDVTGSMSPYIAQVVVWLSEVQKHSKQDNGYSKDDMFFFFNDGDNKPSKKKKPLETKGIYSCDCESNVDQLTQIIAKAMRNGSGGGESLENDVEAVIEGLKHHPSYGHVVLIADNMESMRDYDYIKKIKVPVHIILCGAEHRINIQYLDLARQTGGSVHTKTSDITNLQELKNGEEITIDEKQYRFEGGRFHFVYEAFKYQNRTVR